MQASHTSVLVIALVTALAIPAGAQAAIKCWTNKEGVRECGNTIPPEYAQQETRTLSNRGITIEVKERAKTPEELEQERVQREAEEARLAEQARKRKERAEYDVMLLSTFTSEEEMFSSRDRKLSSIDATIEMTRGVIESLHKKDADYKKKAAQYERSGKPLPDGLKEDMANLEKQVSDKEVFIQERLREKEELRERYEEDVKRFRELKSTKPR